MHWLESSEPNMAYQVTKRIKSRLGLCGRERTQVKSKNKKVKSKRKGYFSVVKWTIENFISSFLEQFSNFNCSLALQFLYRINSVIRVWSSKWAIQLFMSFWCSSHDVPVFTYSCYSCGYKVWRIIRKFCPQQCAARQLYQLLDKNDYNWLEWLN